MNGCCERRKSRSLKSWVDFEKKIPVRTFGACCVSTPPQRHLGRPKGAVADRIKHQDRIVALRGNGVSIRKIADLVGVSPSTVQKALRRADGRDIVLTVI